VIRASAPTSYSVPLRPDRGGFGQPASRCRSGVSASLRRRLISSRPTPMSSSPGATARSALPIPRTGVSHGQRSPASGSLPSFSACTRSGLNSGGAATSTSTGTFNVPVKYRPMRSPTRQLGVPRFAVRAVDAPAFGVSAAWIANPDFFARPDRPLVVAVVDRLEPHLGPARPHHQTRILRRWASEAALALADTGCPPGERPHGQRAGGFCLACDVRTQLLLSAMLLGGARASAG
jgi:hypothetical protein